MIASLKKANPSILVVGDLMIDHYLWGSCERISPEAPVQVVDVKEENKDKNTLSVSSRYLSLFPNFIIGSYFPNQIGVYLNVPISPGLTTQKRIIYTTDGKTMSEEKINTQKKIWLDVY